MKLSTFKQHLNKLNALHFVQTNGALIPAHFHITEAGLSTKHFVDCGGTLRTEKNITLQLWTANDTEHRLAPAKLSTILEKAAPLFGNDDLAVEIEYQMDTISRYALDFGDNAFVLIPKFTNCLALDHCGIPQQKPKVQLAELQTEVVSCCAPGGTCC